ncbi:MAG: hypothetical protein BWY67_01351 [Bacteroidetes bacterium ADurb.Bin397]|nr:MAG: hypothetical protein BWY67_01351 [Bacteroidetes bacterium ADurb.Bin397]
MVPVIKVTSYVPLCANVNAAMESEAVPNPSKFHNQLVSESPDTEDNVPSKITSDPLHKLVVTNAA